MNEHLTTERLIDYLHHALSPEEDAQSHAHVQSCALCAAAYEREAALSEALRASARADERELPPGFRARVLARAAAGEARRSPFAAVIGWLRPAIAIPVAAAIALAAYAVPRYATPAAPTIAAAYYLNDHADMDRTLPFANSTGAVPPSLTADATTSDHAVAVMPVIVTADDDL